MNKLILTVGISGSGKSTWSANECQNNIENSVIVNRDKLREGFYGFREDNIKHYYYRSDLYHLENAITKVEDNLIEHFLNEGKNVIVDSTKLKARYLNRFDIFSMHDIEIVFFNITLKEALVRNKSRVRQVDEDIIVRQYDNYVNLRKFLTTNKLKLDYICTEINN